MSFEFGFSRGVQPKVPGNPKRVCILGDFTGSPGASNGPFPLDPERIVDLFEILAPSIRIALAGQECQFSFGSIESFHPDCLLTTPGPLAALLSIRTALADPACATKAMEEARFWIDAPVGDSRPPTSDAGSTAVPDDSFERLLGGSIQKTDRPSKAAEPSRNPLDTLIKNLVGATSTPTQPGVATQATIKAVEDKLAKLLRQVLWNPNFQAMESRWRSLDLLIQYLSDGDEIELWALHCPVKQLAAPEPISKILAEAFDEESPVLLGLYSFGATPEDAALAAGAARIAQTFQTIFLAAAAPSLLGLETFSNLGDAIVKDGASIDAPAWTEFLQTPSAAFLGLALPRFLLRLPYGAKTELIETFEFEEYCADFTAECYLWGNPSLLCAIQHVLAGTGNPPSELGPIPIHTIGSDVMSQCTQSLLSRQAVDKVISGGLIPVVALKNRNAIQVPTIQALK